MSFSAGSAIDLLILASKAQDIKVVIDTSNNTITVGEVIWDCTYQPVQEAALSILTEALRHWAMKPKTDLD